MLLWLEHQTHTHRSRHPGVTRARNTDMLLLPEHKTHAQPDTLTSFVQEQKHDVASAEAWHSLNMQTFVCKEHLTVQVMAPEEADAMLVVPLDDSLQGFHILQRQLAHISHPFLLERCQTHVPVTHTTHPFIYTHLNTLKYRDKA